MEKMFKVKVEFKNGKVFDETVSEWLWDNFIYKDIEKSDNILHFTVETSENSY